MERGQRVTVRIYGNKQVERVVWQDAGKGVLLTTEGEYQKAQRDGIEPIVVGFPKEDIVGLLEPSPQQSGIDKLK